jgi:hypothetical protein
MFGYSEFFADFDYCDPGVDYVCFTDDPHLKSEIWRFVLINNPTIDPARLSKRYKHLPHLFLPEYERSLYIDNTIKLKVTPSSIFERFKDDQMVSFRHPKRDCIYIEADVVKRARYDDPEIINRQMELYRSVRYPANNGLNANGFLLRCHSSTDMRDTCFEWHSQLLRFSKRDQLSWNFCAWLNQFSFTSIDEDLHSNSMFDWPVLVSSARIPRDFDDDIYLSLNPDVKQASMNARQHYLYYGFEEKRRYRP